MRIAIGQLWQETNTFNPLPTERLDFEQFGILRGDDLLRQMADTNELGGFIQSLRTWPERPQIVGLLRAGAWPGGMAACETFQWLQDEMTAALSAQLPVDGVLLALHGAMVAEQHPDVEGQVLRATRQLIGPHTPLVATLDLHANVTQQMVNQADALVLYHTAPHVDVFETGCRGAAVMRRILIQRARPVTALVKLPMVVPAERANTEDAASVSHRFKRRLQQLEAGSRILAAGLATVQPWLDIAQLGASVVIVSDGEAELAKLQCTELAAEVWSRRHDYLPELLSAEEAVEQAQRAAGGLVVLSDAADATTSGAPGDSNWILRELLKYDWPRQALVTLVGENVVRQARQAGAGAEITTALGGLRDTRFSRPLELTVRVERLFDARFILSGHLSRNLPVDMGPAVVLRKGNVHVVVTSRTGPHYAPELFRAAGLDPFAASVLVAKSPCGFRAAYQSRAAKVLSVKAPGCAPPDFWNYSYRQIPRPLWPWDVIDHWEPSPQLYPNVANRLALRGR